jgi:oligopeptide transport system ATP-binding protein
MSGALNVDDLGVTFQRRGQDPVVAVDGVSLSLPASGAVGLVGESGSGKSTVARVIAGIQRPDRGQVRLDGELLQPRRSSAQHRAIQLVFQDPYSSLNPRRTVRSVLRELLAVHELARGSQADARCAELMALVGLPEAALDRKPAAFSGGQRQRLAIARALAVDPSVIVADEPVSALDVSIQATILELFAKLRAELGVSLLLISHNLAVVRQLCDQVAVMYRGEIVEFGERDQIFSAPQHAYTQTLLDAVPRLGHTGGAATGPAAARAKTGGAKTGGAQIDGGQ